MYGHPKHKNHLTTFKQILTSQPLLQYQNFNETSISKLNHFDKLENNDLFYVFKFSRIIEKE